ncbi:MAG TPA: relaxase domain-containing protein [Pseudonocardiaceae bacterium]|nr:relaxase domain-containing protein [Pseudonocardiaceae bacterium]
MRAVEEAVIAGARAAVDYLQDWAGYARGGHHGGGAGQWIDAHTFVVAQFLQHDSRDGDPQLHVCYRSRLRHEHPLARTDPATAAERPRLVGAVAPGGPTPHRCDRPY